MKPFRPTPRRSRDVTSPPRPFVELLGTVATLRVLRFASPGAFLAPDDDAAEDGADVPTVLLPGAEVPPGTLAGDELAVFVHLDSEGRPLATLRTPKLTLGEVAFLEVTAVGPFGAFVDWGLPKELLVPYAEQIREIRVGERHAVGLYRDNTGRLAGTLRVTELLRDRGRFRLDQWVDGEAWRNEPGLGLFVILARRHVGMVPADEPHALSRGQAARFRIANLLPDGKLELSLRGHALEELDRDAARVLAALSRSGAVRVGDHSSPEALRAEFGLSKKTCKRAVGRLMKQGAVVRDAEGCWVLR